ncbi:MAG TPA: Stk1 family PASTA domain-containing Ser/Thr kinase [Mycobacteriales bacterium]|nr:Stk1 family PASTA domain-containing Ser/Thr kinase [Mycobacteriales bacterium]
MAKATLLGGRYELGETLGVGGMAEVRSGRDARLGRDVAVKILRTELAADPTFLARFRREAQAAASLNHPHIVAVYDTGEDDGVPYIVMEYVQGKTLRDVLRSEGRMLPQRALEIVADVCAALEYSHIAGIVHRDIKPANVMLTSDGTVKVMDFGIARATTSQTMTQTAAVLGTAQYLSPEQARGEHVDARSDVYSTGCLLYELLTHTPPFSGDSPVAVAYQHVREDPELPSQRAPGLSPNLDAIVLKAMAKNPGNRYQTAAEFRDDLLRAFAGRPVAATPILRQQDATSLLMPEPGTAMLPAAGEGRRIGRGAGYAGLLIAVLLVFSAAALLARSLTSNGDSDVVRMPDLLKLTEGAARDAVEEAGLEVGEVVKQPVDPSQKQTQPAGTVIDQDPIGRVSVRAGSKVKLIVSTGVRRVRVPSVVGTLLGDARGQLADLQLQISRVDLVDGAKRENEVLVINPPPGTEVEAGSKVIVAVSSGKVAVPDVVGLDEATATGQLRQAGFTVKVQREVRGDQPAGTVVRMAPGGKAKAPYGSEVVIVVAQEPQASPTPQESPSSEPFPSDPPSPEPSPSPTPIP